MFQTISYLNLIRSVDLTNGRDKLTGVGVAIDSLFLALGLRIVRQNSA